MTDSTSAIPSSAGFGDASGTTSNVRSLSLPVQTPAPSSAPAQDDDSRALCLQWQMAQEDCAESLELRTEEKAAVKEFDTYQQLLENLKEEEVKASQSRTAILIAQTYPCLKLMDSLSRVFAASLSGFSVKVTLLWGLIYLSIKAALDSQAVLMNIVNTLSRIRERLSIFKRYAPLFHDRESNSEMRYAIKDMFVALIHFWAHAVRPLRMRTDERGLLKFWTEQNHLNEAIDKLTNCIDRVKDLAALSRVGGEELAARQRTENLLSLLTIREESDTHWPCDIYPASSSHFKGRVDVLASMESHLQPSHDSRDFKLFIIHGTGGVGKSTLAMQYAEVSRKNDVYNGIFWIRAESSARIRASFEQIFDRLRLIGVSRDLDVDGKVVAVQNWLAQTGMSWLLIYDNVQEYEVLSDYLPQSNGRVLLTTRYSSIALGPLRRKVGTKTLELPRLSDSDSKSLFNDIRRSHDPECDLAKDEDELDDLLKGLDGLALGIEQFASYIGHYRYPLTSFQDKYRRKGASILAKNWSTNDHSLATLWDMHFEKIRSENHDAWQVLAVLCFLNPDEIPQDLLMNVPSDAFKNDDISLFNDEDRLDNAIEALDAVALVKKISDKLSMHRLVQVAFVHSLNGIGLNNELRQSYYDATAYILNHHFPKMGGPDHLYDKWTECAKLDAHAESMAITREKLQTIAGKPMLASSLHLDEVLKNCCWYRYETGGLKDSLALLNLAEQACVNKSGMVYSQLCNNYACVYYELNDLTRCREYNEKCLEIRKAKLRDENHIEMANSLNNHANLLLAENRLEEALVLYLETARVESLYPENPPEYLALTKLSVGRVYTLMYEFTTAWSALEEAGSNLKPQTWVMAILDFTKGNWNLEQRQHKAAKECFTRALATTLEQGPTQMFTAACHYKVGICFASMADADSAIAELDMALRIACHNRDEGYQARILRQKAAILTQKGELSDNDQQDAMSFLLQAEKLRMKVVDDLKIASTQLGDEKAYDELVCAYWR